MSYTSVVAYHGVGDIGVGPNDGDGPVITGRQRQGPIPILQQNNSLSGRFKSQLFMGRGAHISRAQIKILLPQPVKHPQTKLDCE